MDKKYLKFTIHDNDFQFEHEYLAELFNKLFQFYGSYPKEDQLDILAEQIKYIWYHTNKLVSIINGEYREESPAKYDYFKPDLELVDEEETKEWDNQETAFIPAFKTDKVIFR